MQKKQFNLGFYLMITLVVASYGMNLAQAESTNEDWGSMGYAHPSPEVEAMPIEQAESISQTSSSAEVTSDKMASLQSPSSVTSETIQSQPAEVEHFETPADSHLSRSSESRPTNISTVKNTYGVMTEQDDAPKFYFAPFGGITSFFGNETVSATPRYAAGASAGFLVSNYMTINVGFTHSEQDLSNPILSTLNATGPSNIFNLSQNSFDAGAKLFFLGRESRLRPYFGGGAGYSSLTIKGNQLYLGATASTWKTSQMNAYGELGAEFAITRAIVANALFKLDGVLSHSNSTIDSPNSGSNDTNLVAVGNSLSRTANFTVAAGLGIYF